MIERAFPRHGSWSWQAFADLCELHWQIKPREGHVIDYAIPAPVSVPPQLRDFAARGYHRINRPALPGASNPVSGIGHTNPVPKGLPIADTSEPERCSAAPRIVGAGGRPL